MSILKTKQCERFFNLSPTIFIYDLDGTIIDSSHRATHDAQGNIDLPAWRQKNTKDHILKDSLMPLYWKLRADYKNGNMIILCTAREIGEWDKEFIHSHNIYFDKIISRDIGDVTTDSILKANQLAYLYRLKQFAKYEKVFYDDNLNNLKAIAKLGEIYNQPTYCYEPFDRGALYHAY